MRFYDSQGTIFTLSQVKQMYPNVSFPLCGCEMLGILPLTEPPRPVVDEYSRVEQGPVVDGTLTWVVTDKPLSECRQIKIQEIEEHAQSLVDVIVPSYELERLQSKAIKLLWIKTGRSLNDEEQAAADALAAAQDMTESIRATEDDLITQVYAASTIAEVKSISWPA